MTNAYNRRWENGNWSVICDTCGRKRKRSECKLSYDSGNLAVFVTCADTCSDERHPLNDPPPIYPDGLPVPDARPDYIASNPNYGRVSSISQTGQTTTNNNSLNSNYRWGTNWPGRTWNTTNDGTGFSLNPLALWGQFP